MKSFALAALMLFLATTPAAAADLVNVAGASAIALDGYDPVAFFTDGKPVNGSPTITAIHKGATYFFSTDEHRRMFSADPEKYAPQFGGFCAFGVSVGALFPVDITTWQIVDGKLYLNLNPEILEKFNADVAGHLAKATAEWPKLKERHGKQSSS